MSNTDKLQENIKQMLLVTKEEFEDFVDDGHYTDQDVIDLHEAVLFLHSQLEQAQGDVIQLEAENEKLKEEVKQGKEVANELVSWHKKCTAENEQLKADKQKLVEGLKLISTRTMSQFMNGSMMAGNMQDIAKYVLSEVKGNG